jgi:hypothetical protein
MTKYQTEFTVLMIQYITSFDCNGDRYRCSPNVPHLLSGVIIVYVIDIIQLCYNRNDIVIEFFEHLKKKCLRMRIDIFIS